MSGLIIAAFITGLTAGGISCFAVQGGLITGSIARQLEGLNPLAAPAHEPARGKASKPRPGARQAKTKQGASSPAVTQSGLAQAIGLFLLAKLVAYTLLGFLLGWLGSVVSLSLGAKGVMQILIGIFLIGNALRMFNVHPIFRYFNFEPPQAVTRYIRRLAKGGDGRVLTPLYLGALTVLIPCGVTQSVMAVAVGTGNAFAGAMIMAAFVIGSSPAFFSVTMLAASLGRLFQKWFYPAVSVIVLVLGLYTVETGLNLLGSPYSAASILRSLRPAPTSAPAQVVEPGQEVQPFQVGDPAVQNTPAGETEGAAVIEIEAGAYGYSPDQVTAPANQPISLRLVTKETWTCARSFAIPSLGIAELLPPTGEMVIDLPAQPAGTSIPFTCSMGMFTGVINIQ